MAVPQKTGSASAGTMRAIASTPKVGRDGSPRVRHGEQQQDRDEQALAFEVGHPGVQQGPRQGHDDGERRHQLSGSGASVDERSSHETVTYSRAHGSPSPWLISDGSGPVERRTMESRLVVGHGEAQLDAVVSGHGVVQLATRLAEQHLASGRLVELLPGWRVDGLPLRLVWLQSKQLLPKVDALLTRLAAKLRIR